MNPLRYPLIERLERELGGALQARLVCKAGAVGSTLRLVDHAPVVWDAELGRLATELGGPTVFCCGPRPLSEAVRVASRAAGLKFRTESF